MPNNQQESNTIPPIKKKKKVKEITKKYGTKEQGKNL